MDFGSNSCIPILICGNKQGYLVGMIVKIPKRLVHAELAQQGVTGSNPVLRTILGYRQMVKAQHFDCCIWWFESTYPSYELGTPLYDADHAKP